MSWKLSTAGIAGLLALLLSSAASAAGVQAGDWLVRGGFTGVFPTSQPDSDNIILDRDLPAPLGGLDTGTQAKVKNGYALGLTFGYMITNNWAVELLAALPYFKHDIEADDGVLEGLGVDKIGEIKMLPPSLNGQYHFNTGSPWKPYLGAGVTYFWVLDESNKLGTVDLPGLGPTDLSGADFKVDNTWGPNVQVGVDYIFSNNWMINADLRYMWLETKAEVEGVTEQVDNVKINPVVFSVQVGYKF
jgi:outer membrane protein